MSSAINWSVLRSDPVLQHPLYLKWSKVPISGLNASQIKTDIKSCQASNEAAGIVAYLSWLLRVVALVA